MVSQIQFKPIPVLKTYFYITKMIKWAYVDTGRLNLGLENWLLKNSKTLDCVQQNCAFSPLPSRPQKQTWPYV